jgi:hypothetical protein
MQIFTLLIVYESSVSTYVLDCEAFTYFILGYKSKLLQCNEEKFLHLFKE